MYTHTKETQSKMTPESSLQNLREGNKRFQENVRLSRNLVQQVRETASGQYPYATVLSCIDSRVSS